MYRMGYRKFADHERVVINHSVDNGGRVAVRWYEVLDLSGAVRVNQQGTFAPDTTHRWMASAAMDKANDIAIGYSASSKHYQSRDSLHRTGAKRSSRHVADGSQHSGRGRIADQPEPVG